MNERPHLVRAVDAVLVVIDVQERLAAAMPHRSRVVNATSRLLRAAALLGMPIVVTLQNPDGLGGLVPELADVLASPELASADVRTVDKMAFCCSLELAFTAAMSATGRSQVVICGMETHICVTQSALALAADGYETYVAADACCSIDDGDAHTALDRLRADDVEVLTSQSAMYEAVRRAGTDEFRALLRIVKGG
ncbi:MAG TPA: isochorismatase family protein [Coriobacteriia bacterium]|jgi:nicotinamidase-related amidase